MSHIVDVSIPDYVVAGWKHQTGMDLYRIMEDAFAFYVWALEEIWRGRVVLSSDLSLKSPQVITVPTLTAAAANRRRLLVEMGASEPA